MRRLTIHLLAAAAMLQPVAAAAQAAPPATLTPVQPEAPAQPTSPAPTPAPPAAIQPGVDPNALLGGRKGDASQVDELTLPARTVLIISGQSTWEEGFDRLMAIYRELAEIAGKSGVAVAGRPVTHYIETDDMSFRYEAMLPVDKAPAAGAQLGPARVGATPAGKALRFVYVGPYDDIDGVYEGITAYLDAKGLTVRDQFLEEYVNDAKDRGDPALEVNIYVLPR
jgi:effector-binding domain-containing protein